MATKHQCRETEKAMKILMLWILGFLPLVFSMNVNVSDHDELEIMKLLKKLNKPYVKSIKSPSGDIIDCVPFHLQPAFDHPLNKNVTYENTWPSFQPERFSGNHSSNRKPLTQLWHTNGRCPERTVPIIRVTREAILRAKSVESYGKKIPGTFRNRGSPSNGQTNDEIHEYAVRAARRGVFHGTKAQVGVWNPRVERPNEFSLAQLWIHAGSGTPDMNSVEAGWQILPNLYGDRTTRLFGYYTSDQYRHGHYNLAGGSFVQRTNSITLGGVIAPISTYGAQHEISIFIYKDPISGHWWLEVDDDPIGYWPNHLFTLLRDGPATGLEWGGEVINSAINGRHTTTQMGSGSFSSDPNAAGFTNLQYLDKALSLLTPRNLETIVTHHGCYNLRPGQTERLGELFYYGGPGRNPSCL